MVSGPGCSGSMGSDSVCMGWLVTRAALKASEMTREPGAAQEALVAWVSKAWAAQGSQISNYPVQHRWELLPGRGSSKSYGCRWLRLTRCRTTNELLGIIKPEELANIESGISRKMGKGELPRHAAGLGLVTTTSASRASSSCEMQVLAEKKKWWAWRMKSEGLVKG